MLLSGAALALLSGCEGDGLGHSGRNAEWARSKGAFSVVSATPGRAVVSANGQQVAVEPPPGFCLSDGSVETSERSAFVLIGDCVLDGPGGTMAGLDGEPGSAGMRGMMTVSISGGSGLPDAAGGDLSDLEAYLSGPEGRALLSRGGDAAQVSVVETRRQGGILYVLVEDRSAGAVEVLAPRFWRAFVELNGRLAVVTLSGFSDVPMLEDEMLRHVGEQVRQLQVANAVPPDEAPVQVAAASRRPRPLDAGSGHEPGIATVDAEPRDAPDALEPAWAALAGGPPDNAPGPPPLLNVSANAFPPPADSAGLDAGGGSGIAEPAGRGFQMPDDGAVAALAMPAGAGADAAWADRVAGGDTVGDLAEGPILSPGPAPGASAGYLAPTGVRTASGWPVPAPRPGLGDTAMGKTEIASTVRADGARQPFPNKLADWSTRATAEPVLDRPDHEPLVIASTAPAVQGSWPVPVMRPIWSGGAARMREPGPAAQPRQAEVSSGVSVPLPVPRMDRPGSRAGGGSCGFAGNADAAAKSPSLTC